MTIKYELRTDRPDKAGYCKLRISISDKGVRKFEPMGVKLFADQWDAEAQEVRKNHPMHQHINRLLKIKMAEVVTREFSDKTIGIVDEQKVVRFRAFAIDAMSRWEKTKSKGTIRAYTSMLRKVTEFAPDITIDRITPTWLIDFETWSRNDGCDNAGALKRVSFVSTIINEAIRCGHLEKSPFLVYRKPKKENPPRFWLTMDEMQRLHDLKNGSDIINNTATWFLLSCYTGLRYSDVEVFDKDTHIMDGRIVLYTTKTGEVVSLKIHTKLQELLDRWPTTPVYTNQKVNQYLKAVARVAKINKPITFHSGRHTFAVQCANMGMSAEVVSKLLGHSDLKTTAIYYKIVNSRIDAEMDKWG